MNRVRILKYVLEKPITTLAVPAHSKVLSVACQKDESGIWRRVIWLETPMVNPHDPEATEGRVFAVMTTGEAFDPDGLTYVGTAIREGHVAHIYEVTAVLTDNDSHEPRRY